MKKWLGQRLHVWPESGLVGFLDETKMLEVVLRLTMKRSLCFLVGYVSCESRGFLLRLDSVFAKQDEIRRRRKEEVYPAMLYFQSGVL